MPDIIFTRVHHSLEEEFGDLSDFGGVEISSAICCLAAFTRQHNYATEIIDALPLGMNNVELAAKLADKNPRYVGITASTLDIFGAADLAEKLKKVNSNITVIIGGPHVTAVPKETMERFPFFDIGVLGEGELVIIELLNTLEGKYSKTLSAVNGITFRDNERVVVNKRGDFVQDLDALPLPAWDLLPNIKEHYFAPAWTNSGGRTATIMTSRGCPHLCIYCDRKVFGNRIRLHSAEYVLNMIRTLHSTYGIDHFRIGDDNFMINKRRLITICDGLIDEKLNISWACLARANSIDEAILPKMKQAGCTSLSFGVETGAQKIHDIEKKKVTLEQIEKAIRLTRKAGIKTISYNIIGHPLETIETIKSTIRFNKKIKVDEFKIQFMVPLPGSELYEVAEKYGTFDKDWSKLRMFSDEPVFVPHGLSKEDLIKWNKKAFISFYFQPRILLSHLLKIRSFREIRLKILGGLTMLNWKIKELMHQT